VDKIFKVKTTQKGGKIKKVAEADQPVVGIEVIVEPIVVQVPAIAIPIEIERVAVAIGILPDKSVQNIIYTTAP